MTFSLLKYLTKLVGTVLTLVVTHSAFAQQPILELKPAKCVSLHQGQMCYADVELRWQYQRQGDYCLISSTQTTPLACWQQATQGDYAGEIASKTNVVFTLVQQGQQAPLATSEMKMAWVYKRKRAAVSWRVF